MVRLPATASSPSPMRFMRVDWNVSSGNFSTSKKSALLRCASRCASRVLMEAASTEASTWELARSVSSRASRPWTLVNWPFTFEIIMCLTLNSATEWTGSMFQVAVDVCGVASVLMVVLLSFFLSYLRCVMTIIVATYIWQKKSDHGLAGGLQKIGQGPHPLPSQMAQLPAMAFLDRFIETGQQFESVGRDPGHDHAAVLGFAAT